MALPEPPEGEPSRALQAIWDHAFETGKWPTFAQLDHRWDRNHESDVLEVLRQLPRGLTYGSGFESQPQDSTVIGLTVAGANCCQGAEEALSVFIDFIRVATSIQRGWQPPGDDPEAQPSMTEQDYIRQANGLPAAGWTHLLALLYLLIRSEPSLWIGLGGPDNDGHWQASLHRNIRTFRNVTTLDEYWALRFKSWEPAVQEPEAPVAENLVRAMFSIHLQALSDVLLTWIYTAAEGYLTPIVPCTEFQPSTSPAQIEKALRRLEAQGHVNLYCLDGAVALPHAQLTMSGAVHVENNRERWNNRTYRDCSVRNALLAWLHDQSHSPQGAALISNFFGDPRCILAGHLATAADVDTAAAYLQDKRLIQGTGAEDHHLGPTWARLTANGIDCVEQGGDVADYLTPRPVGGATYHFHGPVSGTNVAVGDNATQHATINGIDTENIRILIEGITQALPGLALRGADEQEAKDAAAQALAEVKESQPSHPRLRAALTKIGSVLASAGNQALAAVLRAGIDYEMAKLGLPPGS
jgi:hypothetical protein